MEFNDEISKLEGNLKVVGRIGTGKTNILKVLASKLNSVLVIDLFDEYGDIEEIAEDIKVVKLNRNEMNSTIKSELKEEHIKMAANYKYIIVDEPHFIDKEQFISLLQEMEKCGNKVIAAFITTGNERNLYGNEDIAELAEHFPYIIDVDEMKRAREKYQELVARLGGREIILNKNGSMINPLFTDFQY